MTYNITQEEIEKIKNLEGEVRGAVFKTDEHFILKTGGEEKIKEAEEQLSEWGYSFKYKESGEMEFYPFSLRIFSILAALKVLGLKEEEVKKMGHNAPKVSFVIKFFTRYFLSPKQTISKIEEVWKKHSTAGKVAVREINEKEGTAVFHFEEFDFHPLYCKYLSGYLEGAISMALGKETSVEETRCAFKGEDVHEFKVKW